MKYCSACGKSTSDEPSEKLAENLEICHGCLSAAVVKMATRHEIEHPTPQPTEFSDETLCLTPRDIKQELDEHIIGQETAKKQISIAAYNHIQRCHTPEINGVKLRKSNIMMVGPSGTGKTLIAETLADVLDVPFASINATDLTENGYVGADIDSIVVKLLRDANFDATKAMRGIVFLDEVDKLAKKESYTRNSTGLGVQQSLLKMIEGTIVSVSPDDAPENSSSGGYFDVDTSNILFICGGAFEGIDEIVKAGESKPGTSYGFNASLKPTEDKSFQYDSIKTEHLLQYGMIREFIGRIPVLAALQPMTKASLKKILTEPKNSFIDEYKALFSLNDTELTFTQRDIDYIASEALSRGLGARALRSIIEEHLMDRLFEVPGQDISKIRFREPKRARANNQATSKKNGSK